MKIARALCTIALTFAVVSPVFAAGKTKGDKTSIAYYKQIDGTLKTVTLTDDQTSKLDALKKEYEQKFKDDYAKEDVMTPEQKTAAKEAAKTAKAAGKKGKEVKDAVADAVKLTDDQKAKAKDATAALHALEKEFRGKVMDLLTDAQKQSLKGPKPGKSAKAAAK